MTDAQREALLTQHLDLFWALMNNLPKDRPCNRDDLEAFAMQFSDRWQAALSQQSAGEEEIASQLEKKQTENK